MVEFGEQVFYFVPKRLRSKLNLRWRVGTFLGNSQSTNECFVAAANGDVVKTRAVTRFVEGYRWSATAVLGVKGTPDCFRPSSPTESDVSVEQFLDPHANADAEGSQLADSEMDAPEMVQLDKQVKMTSTDLDKFVYSDTCQRSSDIRNGIRRP